MYASTETYQPDELPAVVLPAAAGQEVDAQTMADHQRYFFFQAMSTVGALVLLVVHGPGNFSMDEQHHRDAAEVDGHRQRLRARGGSGRGQPFQAFI